MITNLDSFSWIVMNGLGAAFSLVCFLAIFATNLLVPNHQNVESSNVTNEKVSTSTKMMFFSLFCFVFFLIMHFLAIKGIYIFEMNTKIFRITQFLELTFILGGCIISLLKKRKKRENVCD